MACVTMQEVLLFPAMKPDVKKKEELDVKKSDEWRDWLV